MERDELFEAKLDFLAERYVELMNHLIAFDQSARDSDPFPEPLAKQLHSDELKGFSQLLEALNNHVDGKEDSRRGLFEKQVNLLMSNSTPDIELLRHPLIDPGYTFSDEWSVFKGEFFAVIWFFLKSEGADPQVDLALMKVLFELGKIIGRLKQKGYVHRDLPRGGGDAKWKGYVSHEQVIEAAKKMPKRITSRRGIARLVEEQLIKAESKKENPLKVYDKDYIRKHILPKK